MFDGRRFGWEHRAALACVRWWIDRFEMARMYGWPW
jgi:hypothetical protein